MAEVVRDRPSAGSDRERRAPQPVVGVADRRVDPDERHERGDHEQDGARGGFLEELLQRANHAPVQRVGRCHASRSCRPDFPAHLRNRHMLPAGRSTPRQLFTGSSHRFGCGSSKAPVRFRASCQTVDTHPRLPASSPRTSSSVGWLWSRLWCWASSLLGGDAGGIIPGIGGSPKPPTPEFAFDVTKVTPVATRNDVKHAELQADAEVAADEVTDADGRAVPGRVPGSRQLARGLLRQRVGAVRERRRAPRPRHRSRR